MKRRTKWILGLGIGIPIVLVSVGMLVLWVLSPNVNEMLSTIERKELPEGWAEETPVIGDMGDEAAVEAPEPTVETIGLPVKGTLVILGNGRPFGEESFAFDIEDESVVLHTEGKYWFKALFAKISVSFDQVLSLDTRLRPVAMRSVFDGPLGFDSRMDVDVDEDRVIVHARNGIHTYDGVDRLLVVGTFSSYATIPLLYELGELDGATAFQLLLLGGPSDRDTTALPTMLVEKAKDVTIQSGETSLFVDRYVISSDTGTMTLFAKGSEFLGLRAGDEEQSLLVYRGDYFAGGFEVIDEATSQPDEKGEGD